MIPKRNSKQSDDAFVEKQLSEIDKNVEMITCPKGDEKVLQEMGLTPINRAVHWVEPASKTPQEARIDSVNDLLKEAYKNASNLKLTSEETKLLTAEFSDSDFRRGANGKEDLIYIEHQALRRRLTDVLGIGQWTVIIRRNWTEDFLTAKKEAATRVYVEGILIVRGCFVAEAIGDGTYYKSNANGNFGDAYESAKSAVIRRLCKDMGIGLQAWNKDFCEAWKAKYKQFQRP